MTRTQNSQSENHGRYIASAELADLRGVSAVPVAYRAAALPSAAKREFIWWLQGESLAEGGFRRFARELLEMFPERLGTHEMREAKLVPEKIYPADLLLAVQNDLDIGNYLLRAENKKSVTGAELIELCRNRALSRRVSNDISERLSWRLSIEEFLIELCINPKIEFDARASWPDLKYDSGRPDCEADSSASGWGFKGSDLVYFEDIIGAVSEYRTRKEKAVRENFYVTEIGRQIWDSLDFALHTRSMVLVYGREGRGKTEAIKAWAQLHSGQARFVSLKGIATKTAAFREIALALGITASYNLTGSQLQSKIEDVLKMSGLMLVIDEAHFLFNQSQSTKARPELIDWLDTAIANRRLPVALCTTPQFMDCMARAAYQVHWNYNQFRRRVKRWMPLPEENTEADILGVASKVFAGASSPVVKKVASYVFASGRDLSALGDVATELREALGHSDFSKATFKLVDQIIRENLYPSDTAFATEMEQARQRIRKGRKQSPPVPPMLPGEDEPAGSGDVELGPIGDNLETMPADGNRPRFVRLAGNEAAGVLDRCNRLTTPLQEAVSAH